jgi:hypothetical protein
MRARAARLGTGSPNSDAEPPLGRMSPIRMRMVVVLPAPFGPTKPKISPGSTANEMPSTATTRRRENGV